MLKAIYTKNNGNFFDNLEEIFDNEGVSQGFPPFNTTLYTDVEPPFNPSIATNPFETLEFVGSAWVVTYEKDIKLANIIDKLYSIRDEYINKNLFYLGDEFVNNEKTSTKVTGMVLTFLIEGKVDSHVVIIWNCVNSNKPLTFLELKTLGLLLGEQEQKARAILTTFVGNYSSMTIEELQEVDVEADFENAWDSDEL